MKKQKEEIRALVPCPCGRPAAYAACCGRFHAGAIAPDAESLMRSRYTAYVLNNEAYLLATWHASTRPESLGLATQPSAQWLGLEVKKHDAASTSANIAANIAANVTASVEFVARYRINGRAVRLHEISRFVHEAGCWYYVDGVVD